MPIDLSLYWRHMLLQIFHLLCFVVHLLVSINSCKSDFTINTMEFQQLLLTLQYTGSFIFFLMSVSGNFLVLTVMLKRKTLRQTSANYYIISIAVADLISGIFAIPFFAYGVSTQGPHQYDVCIWMTSFIFVMFGININLLVALSANRYWAVCHPTSYFTSKENGYQKWIIFTSVFIGFCLGSLPAFGWNSGYFDGACYLLDLVSFSYLFLCCSWTLASSIVIIVLYGLIYKSLAKHSKLRVALFANNALETQQRENRDEEIKITKTMSLVVGSFLLCWMPITIYFLVFAINEVRIPFDLDNMSIGLILLGTSITFTHLNSVIDPLIYAYRIKEVRDAIKGPFKCWRGKDVNIEDSRTTSTKTSRASSRANSRSSIQINI